MDDSQDRALKRLNRLVDQPGELRFIANLHACGVPTGRGKPGPVGDEEAATCAAFEYPMTDPRHFELHDVVSIEDPDDKGYIRAHTAEGDILRGSPVAVLKRLTEANQFV